MIVKKVFECNTKDVDEVILAIADEVRAGYTVEQVKIGHSELSVCAEHYPSFTVTLVRRGKK